jgi:hypothetical protein
MKRPKLQNNPLSWVETKQVELKGVRLSDIQFVSPAKLKVNPLNVSFFKEESGEYFQQLREDIEKRGIIVPLIAKKDDVLLAGHNRLRTARALQMENVPVQYVLDELPANAEQEFIIKDNLFRRQFTSAEWIELYKKLYPDFDEQVHQETRGGGRKWNALHEEKNKTEHSVLLTEKHGSRLTAEKIAQDTGQKLSAVQKQLAKYRKESRANGKVPAATNVPAGKSLQNGAEVLEEVNSFFDGLERKLKKTDHKTIKTTLKKIDAFKSKVEKMIV